MQATMKHPLSVMVWDVWHQVVWNEFRFCQRTSTPWSTSIKFWRQRWCHLHAICSELMITFTSKMGHLVTPQVCVCSGLLGIMFNYWLARKSLDLNPIENLWSQLKKAVAAKRPS